MSTFFNRMMSDDMQVDDAGDVEDYNLGRKRSKPVARPKPVAQRLPPKLPVLHSTYMPPMPIYAAPPPPPPRPLQPQGTGNSTRDAVLGTVNQGLALVGNIFQARAQNSAAQSQAQYVPVGNPGVNNPPPDGSAERITNAAGSSFDKFAASLGISTSTLTLLIGGGALLMFMKPPGKGR